MKVTISSAAGCAAYVDGETLHFFHLGNDAGWRVASPPLMRHVFLQATDLIEVDVSDRGVAEAILKLKNEVTHALRLLELVIVSDTPRVAELAAHYLEEWLGNSSVRSELEKYCFATALPDHVNIETALARTAQPLTSALLREIDSIQPRIASVHKSLDRSLRKVAALHEDQIALKNAFIGSGGFRALVRDIENVPEGFVSGREAGLRHLFHSVKKELESSSGALPKIGGRTNRLASFGLAMTLLGAICTLGVAVRTGLSIVEIDIDGSVVFHSIGSSAKDVILFFATLVAVVSAVALANRNK